MSDLQSYFVTETNKRLDRIEVKLDTLLAFKWQIIGGSMFLSAILAVTIQLLSLYWSK